MSKKTSGFASMSPERLREVTSRGGKAVQAKNLASNFTRNTEVASKAARLKAEQKRKRPKISLEPEALEVFLRTEDEDND